MVVQNSSLILEKFAYIAVIALSNSTRISIAGKCFISSYEMYTNTGGWRRVVYLDMTDPSTTCPSGWQLTGYTNMW